MPSSLFDTENESFTLASPVNFNDLPTAVIIPSSGINLVAIE